MDKIFGYTPEEIRKLSGTKDYEVDPEYRSDPIRMDDTFLEPCIRGAEKILSDPKKREMFYRIYRGERKQ